MNSQGFINVCDRITFQVGQIQAVAVEGFGIRVYLKGANDPTHMNFDSIQEASKCYDNLARVLCTHFSKPA